MYICKCIYLTLLVSYYLYHLNFNASKVTFMAFTPLGISFYGGWSYKPLVFVQFLLDTLAICASLGL